MSFQGDPASNASRIEHEVENLKNNHCDTDLLLYRSNYRYSDFWVQAKQVSEMFKELKLGRDDRERLWSEFGDICDEVKKRQNEDRVESVRNRELLDSLITDAHHQAGGAGNRDELDKARSMLEYIRDELKSRLLFREDRDALWASWRQANENLYWRRNSLQEGNYQNLKEDANGARRTAYNGDPYEARQEIMRVQADMRGAFISRDQGQELHDILQDAWEQVNSRNQEMKEDHIKRWERNVENAENFISRLEEEIRKLEGMEADAKSDEYAEMVRGWIEEQQDKIAEVQSQVKGWEDRIYSTR